MKAKRENKKKEKGLRGREKPVEKVVLEVMWLKQHGSTLIPHHVPDQKEKDE